MRINFRLTQAELETLSKHCQKGESVHLCAKRLMLEKAKELSTTSNEEPEKEFSTEEQLSALIQMFLAFSHGLLRGISDHDDDLFRAVASRLDYTNADPILKSVLEEMIEENDEREFDDSPLS